MYVIRFTLIALLYYLLAVTNIAVAEEILPVVVLAENKANGYSITFSGLSEDFVFTHNPVNGKVEVRLPPKFKITNISALDKLQNLIVTPVIENNNLTFFLRDQGYKLNKQQSGGIFSIALTINLASYLSDNKEQDEGSIIEVNSGNLILQGRGSNTSLVYNTDAVVPSAAFVTNKTLWLIFAGSPKSLTIPQNHNDLIKHIEHINPDNKKNGIIFKITLSDLANEFTPLIRRVQNSWILTFTDSKPKLADIKVTSKILAAPYPKVELQFDLKAEEPIFFSDSSGAKYAAILSKDDMNATMVTYKYVSFKILEAIQGSAIQIYADNLRIHSSDSRIIIERRNELFLSQKKLSSRTASSATTFIPTEIADASSAILNLESYAVEIESFLYTIRKMRMDEINAENPQEKASAMLATAKFLLANGLYQEALGQINLVNNAFPATILSYQANLIKTAALYMQGRLDEAVDIVNKIDVNIVPIPLRKEVKVWYALLHYAIDEVNSMESQDNLVQSIKNSNINGFLLSYPSAFKCKLLFTFFEKAFNKLKPENVATLLNLIKELKQLKYDNLVNYYYARNYLRVNDQSNTKKYLTNCLSQNEDLYTRSRCIYMKAENDLFNSEISKQEYISQLEFAIALWHGDEYEVEVLTKLAEMYAKIEDYLSALRSLRKATNYFPNHPRTLIIKSEITNSLVKYFAARDRDKHLEALQIFYEFHDYMPIGNKGDDIVLQFADHLIALDLLDKAAAILHHQVSYRLMGYKKEEAINKLADIYIQNQQPSFAIEVLRMGDDYKKLPDYIALTRKALLAEALHDNAQDDECIQLLAGDYSARADVIRSAIYWEQQNWGEFLNYAEPSVYELRRHISVLNNAQSSLVLKVAMAYLLTQKDSLLTSLYKDFINRMPEDSMHKKTFEIIYDSWINIQTFATTPKDLIQKIDEIAKELSSTKS